MTTTLPASIAGLLQWGSPILLTAYTPPQRAIYLDVAIQFDNVKGDRLVYAADSCRGTFPFANTALDLSDPTGMEHAKWYLAEKLGMDTSAGVLFYPVEHEEFDHGQYCPAHWVLQVCAGETLYRYVFTEEPTDPLRGGYFFGEAYHGYTTVAGINGKPRAEALRLAVLAIAGVQG